MGRESERSGYPIAASFLQAGLLVGIRDSEKPFLILRDFRREKAMIPTQILFSVFLKNQGRNIKATGLLINVIL